MTTRAKKPTKPITDAQRAKDDELRAKLHGVDMGAFKRLLKKACAPVRMSEKP